MSKNYLRKTIKSSITTAILCTIFSQFNNVSAQVNLTGTAYSENFNNIATAMPAGWSVDSGATATFLGNNISNTYFFSTPAANTSWSNSTVRFKNVASATAYNFYANGTASAQLSDTNRALGIRPSGTFEQRTAFVLAIANTSGMNNFSLSFKLQSLDSTCNRVSTWTIDYGLGTNPTTFTPVATSTPLTTGGNTFSNNTVSVNFGNALDNQNGLVYIRIICLTASTGSGSRTTTAIDDYHLTWSNGGTNITLTETTPTGNNVAVATDSLTLKYDQAIASGNGQITLFKNGQTAAAGTYTVPSGVVSISDSTAVIHGMSLENNTSYYVKMTSGAFTDISGTQLNTAIDDTVTWTFKTIDTIIPPPPTPSTILNESFTNCSTSIGGFTAYSSIGTKSWLCSLYGHTDSAAAYINGGFASGASEANEDWLISSGLFDFSAMTKPILSYWEKSRFDGNVTRSIKISTNYTTGNDPTNSTWITLPVSAMNGKPAGDNTWAQINDIDLTPYKSTPFHIAFTYACDTNGAYELTYDDVKVTEAPVTPPNSIYNISKGSIGIKVIGQATTRQINLIIATKQADKLQIEITDMTGKKLYTSSIQASAGEHIYNIQDFNLNAGLYVIKINNSMDFGVVKCVIN